VTLDSSGEVLASGVILPALGDLRCALRVECGNRLDREHGLYRVKPTEVKRSDHGGLGGGSSHGLYLLLGEADIAIVYYRKIASA
jgi:hypothetical protein